MKGRSVSVHLVRERSPAQRRTKILLTVFSFKTGNPIQNLKRAFNRLDAKESTIK